MKRKIRNFKRGVQSLWYWRKIIWNNRWYSYGYLLALIEHQLKLMADEKNFKNSYSVCWGKTVDQINESLRILQAYNDAIDINEEDEILQEFISSLKVMQNWWD